MKKKMISSSQMKEMKILEVIAMKKILSKLKKMEIKNLKWK